MEIKEFLKRINTHTKAIYENERELALENGNIVNWLLGLASGALLFSFNKYNTISTDNFSIMTIQACIFVIIIVVGFLHRNKTKAFRSNTISMIRMFDFLAMEFELVPNEIENELKNEKIANIFDKYLNGYYFTENDMILFEEISRKQSLCNKAIKVLTILSIVLMLIQFGCFFAIISIG